MGLVRLLGLPPVLDLPPWRMRFLSIFDSFEGGELGLRYLMLVGFVTPAFEPESIELSYETFSKSECWGVINEVHCTFLTHT